MFAMMISQSNLKKGDVGSKTRSLGQISLRPCSPSRGHSFASIFMKLYQNVCLDNAKFEHGSFGSGVSGERICTILVNRLEDLACPVNVWLGKQTALDMTPLG